jgi:hypothetical protein
MKNYKIKSIKDPYSIFGNKCFTKEQDKILKEIGFKYKEEFREYEKHYQYDIPYGYISMILFTGEEYLRFYNRGGRYILPCELEREVSSHYKTLLKIMREDIKKLKEIEVIK